jgi:hypothetical protein
MAAATLEALIESFPHPMIPPITGMPTYEWITAEVIRPLNANAASIHSKRGGGNLGHLALTISPAVFATLPTTPFIPPANPSPTPVIPGNQMAAQINKILQDHKEALHLWRKYKNVDGALINS